MLLEGRGEEVKATRVYMEEHMVVFPFLTLSFLPSPLLHFPSLCL